MISPPPAPSDPPDPFYPRPRVEMPADDVPPIPHDPGDRELAARLGDWEVRVPDRRQYEYLVGRQLWHLQLWHPTERISILTPSRLTRGVYEAHPLEYWKAQASDYDHLVARIMGVHPVTPPKAEDIARVAKKIAESLGGAGRSQQ